MHRSATNPPRPSTGPDPAALAADAGSLVGTVHRSAAALSSLALSVSDRLSNAVKVSHDAAALVHLGAQSIASLVASPGGPVSAAAGMVAQADELATVLNDRLVSIHEDVRALHLALDHLEVQVNAMVVSSEKLSGA